MWASSGNLRFREGWTRQTVTFTAKDDELNDDDESLTFCLVNLPDPYAVRVGQNCGTVNIVDTDDPNSVEVTFSLDTYYAEENGNPAWVRVSVFPVPDREITIPVTFTRGGGLSSADYKITNTTVTFGPDVRGGRILSDDRTYASRPVEIWALDDSLDDDGEYLDLAFGPMPDPFVSEGVTTGIFSYLPVTTRVWFQDNEFTRKRPDHGPGPPSGQHVRDLLGRHV